MEPWRLTAEYLAALEAQARALLGEHYAALVEQRARGMDSQTPPKKPHRLVNAIRRIAATRRTLEQRHGAVDIAAVVEVRTFLRFADAWKDDDAWPAIVATLRNPDDYAHTMILFLAAHLLSKQGNIVFLEKPNTEEGRRVCDLRIPSTGGLVVAVEVKAPEALRRGSRSKLTAKEAQRVVERAIKDADCHDGGQLSPDRCGMLVIGGFGMRNSDLDEMERAANAAFRKRTLSHIGVIQVLSIGAHLENVITDGKSTATLQHGSSFSTRYGIRLCRNPRYLGVVTVNVGTLPLKSLGDQPQELELSDDPELRDFR